MGQVMNIKEIRQKKFEEIRELIESGTNSVAEQQKEKVSRLERNTEKLNDIRFLLESPTGMSDKQLLKEIERIIKYENHKENRAERRRGKKRK
jgi:hypothetical protein